MELKHFLSAINIDKTNIVRNSESPQAAEKLYPAYVVTRCMSSFVDTILLANEINCRGNPRYLTNRQEFEYFLHAIPKKNRFSPWLKPEKDSEKVQLIALLNNYSSEKAEEVADLISEEQLAKMKLGRNQGGVQKK